MAEARKMVVIGAAGGPGSNVLSRAAAAGHQVSTFVVRTSPRDVPAVAVLFGDATRARDLAVATESADALLFCANPRFFTMVRTLPPACGSCHSGITRNRCPHGVPC